MWCVCESVCVCVCVYVMKRAWMKASSLQSSPLSYVYVFMIWLQWYGVHITILLLSWPVCDRSANSGVYEWLFTHLDTCLEVTGGHTQTSSYVCVAELNCIGNRKCRLNVQKSQMWWRYNRWGRQFRKWLQHCHSSYSYHSKSFVFSPALSPSYVNILETY